MTRTRPMLLASLAGSIISSLAFAQPQSPDAPSTTPSTPAAPAAPTAPATTTPGGAATPSRVVGATPSPNGPTTPATDSLGRRIDEGEPIKLSFNEVQLRQMLAFIAETTGKVVLPQPEVLGRTITVLSDKPIPRKQALDLVFLALQQRGIAVIENGDLILLREQADIDRQSVPVIGPASSTLTRTDLGSIAQKIFSLKHASAANVSEVIKNSIPDYAKLATDAESNQVLITGPIIILQRLERVITELDRPQAAAPVTQTFRLRYTDAELIAQNIRDLYSSTARTGQAGNQGGARFPGQGGNQGGGRFNQGGGGGNQGRQAGGQSAAAGSLLVTSNTQQNSVTVLGDAESIQSIARQIEQEWDLPLDDDVVVPRVYELKNTDPIKLKAVLDGMFGTGSAATGQGGGGRTSASASTVQRLAGQFTFQAVPEAGRLVVLSKSPENMAIIDKIIEDLDQPLSTGLPEIIELKHATAEDLAEQLNALLAQEGTLASIRRTDTSLSSEQAGTSPFAQDGTNTNTGNANTQNNANAAANQLQFWWSRARVPTDNAGSSNLVGKARIVPINRQNALMVMAPTEYRKSIINMIERLDRPGRQVLIAAVVVELSGEDATALGARFSNSVINPTRGENAIGTNNTSNITGNKTDLLPSLFDTSVLNIGVNVNVLLQALAQTTNVRILSEPKIFTGDNQEAEFFDGQDIPFISESQPNNNGDITQTFDYRAVGISLRVRPRITPERDVDLKVNLQLSSITPGNTLFGGAVVDRRETTTQAIVADGQTIVVSGIIRTEDSKVKRKIPLLGDIPFFGAPFTSIENVKTTTELVAFVTPIVVNNRSESDKINTPQRERLKELRNELDVPKSPTDTTSEKPADETKSNPDKPKTPSNIEIPAP